MNPAPLIRSIGLAVRKQRTALGLTQNELAEQAGVSDRLVRSLEMGTANGIGLEKLINIISPLGLSLNVVGASDEGQNISQEVTSQGNDYSNALKQAMSRWQPISSAQDSEEQQCAN